MSKEVVAVIAGNIEEFKSYLKLIADKEDKEYLFLNSPEAVLGRKISEVLSVGTFYELKNYDELIYNARACISVEVTK